MGRKNAKVEGETEHGTVVMEASGDQNGFSHDGDEYEVNNGILEVPVSLVPVAETHGFKRQAKVAKAAAK